MALLSGYLILRCWSTVNPLKRKRGRPKGSKKKKTEHTECKADTLHSLKDNSQSEENKTKEDGRQCSLTKDGALFINVTLVFM